MRDLWAFEKCLYIYIYIFYLGFISQTFTNHRTAGEGGEHFFNSSLQRCETFTNDVI